MNDEVPKQSHDGGNRQGYRKRGYKTNEQFFEVHCSGSLRMRFVMAQDSGDPVAHPILFAPARLPFKSPMSGRQETPGLQVALRREPATRGYFVLNCKHRRTGNPPFLLPCVVSRFPLPAEAADGAWEASVACDHSARPVPRVATAVRRIAHPSSAVLSCRRPTRASYPRRRSSLCRASQ